MHDESPDPRVLDALGRAVPQVAPPPALRARVLAVAADSSAGVRPTTPRISRTPWLLAAAATLVAVAASIGWGTARREVRALQSVVAELRSSSSELRNVRAEYERELGARERAAGILSADDVRAVALRGVGPGASARARAYMSPSHGMILTAEGLPDLPADRSYQLWAIVAGQPVSAGVFERAPSGRARLIGDMPAGGIEALAVTVEPAGGLPAPTGAQYLLGTPAN